MSRLTRDQLNIIKDRFGVDKIFSFSRVNTYNTCSWQYYLSYIKNIRIWSENSWSHWGTISHDLIQDFYEGKHSYDDMVSKFDEEVINYNVKDDPELRFPNEDQRDAYLENVRHYFENVKPVEYEMTSEKPVIAVLEGNDKYVFQGYLDGEYLDSDGNLVILDYKTSSISGFTGAKLLSNSRQLMIYAMGVNQHGRQINGEQRQFPIEKIKLRFDMMKYLNVSFIQKNGKEKVTRAERRGWVAKIANQLRRDFQDVDREIEALEKQIATLNRKSNFKKTTEEEKVVFANEIKAIEDEISIVKQNVFDPIEINELIDEAIEMNSLDNLPQFIQDKYTLSDCHIDVELTSEIVDEFREELIATIDEIEEKANEDDLEKAFDRPPVDNSNSFFCQNLCSLRDHCSFFKEFKEHSSMFIDEEKETKSDDDILAMLGLQ